MPRRRQPGAYDNIEQRPLGERCIIALQLLVGPPMLPTYFYNNMKQIVQTKDYVMILTEMVHDVADHPVQEDPRARQPSASGSATRSPAGKATRSSSRRRISTTRRGSADRPEQLKVTERFNRVDDNTILYRFTIEDPTTWARPWTGEYTWALGEADDQLYEYACHEGNYAMVGIMKGARILEDEEAADQGAVGFPSLNVEDERAMLMKNKVMVVAAGAALAFATAVPVVAHHAFGAEFDANRPVLLKGKIVKVELVNPHAWIHVEVVEGRRRHRSVDGRGRHAEHAAAPRHHQEHAHIGTEVVVDGYQSKDRSTRANGRDITFADGKKLFMGSSGTGAPRDGRDPTEPPK